MIRSITNYFNFPKTSPTQEKIDTATDEWDIVNIGEDVPDPSPTSTDDFTSWEQIQSNWGDTSSLVQYTMEGGKLVFSLHPILSDASYRDILLHIDLSYVLANAHTKKDPNERSSLAPRCAQIKKNLTENGWEDRFPLLLGATGSNNQDPDATGFFSYHKQNKLILFTFHGSRNGSKNPFADPAGAGDWGANYAWTQKSAEELGIDYLPPNMQIHGGLGRNFSSVQEQIWDHLNTLAQTMSPEELQGTWIIVTGHSKGGGMANIAAPAIKCFLNQHKNPTLNNLQVAAIPVSSPRVFYGDETQRLVEHILGKRNVLKLNVSGDPVPQTIPRALGGRSCGILALDHLSQVHKRLEALKKGNFDTKTRLWFKPSAVRFETPLSPIAMHVNYVTNCQAIKNRPPVVTNIEEWAASHYGSNFGSSGFSFNPKLLPQNLDSLLEAILNGGAHDPSSKYQSNVFDTPGPSSPASPPLGSKTPI